MVRQRILISAMALFWATAAGAQGAGTDSAPLPKQGSAASSVVQMAPGPLDCAIWANRERLGPTYRQLAQAQGRETAETWLSQQRTALNLHAARMGKAAVPCPA
ncbi:MULTISPECIES: hypothetical protein [Paracoccus]|uniref:hypothetical protein n=1 Tax=Paracoccus TaxID=265 RepID=UPI001E48E544|nr:MULTISPECIES: hypothetical protein [Paracoccus]MDK8874512.1 hypothetical protein [Paracoccus sp. SSJ]UFS65364.1 hypothetical protein LO749_02015 [Paracoccus denitrificans]